MLDTFAQLAWNRLVPFEIHNLADSSFPETNVRTYVIGPDGSRAVWFFSARCRPIGGGLGARVAYHLPYFWATMRVASQNGAVYYFEPAQAAAFSERNVGHRNKTRDPSRTKNSTSGSLLDRTLSALHG